MFSIRNEKNWILAQVLGKNWRTPSRKIYGKSRPRNQKLLKPYEKARPKEKESWREEIIWLRSPFVTCQYPEGFRWLKSHPKPRVGKRKGDDARNVLISTFFRGSKSIKNRYIFCTSWLVGLEEEIIDKDFRQSYWLALQFVSTTKRSETFLRGSKSIKSR